MAYIIETRNPKNELSKIIMVNYLVYTSNFSGIKEPISNNVNKRQFTTTLKTAKYYTKFIKFGLSYSTLHPLK